MLNYEIKHLSDIGYLIGKNGYDKDISELGKSRGIFLKHNGFRDFCLYILKEAKIHREVDRIQEDLLFYIKNIIVKDDLLDLYGRFLDNLY